MALQGLAAKTPPGNASNMSKLELRHYRYFLKLCEERSFTRAAEHLNITPPTLTHQIQML